MSLFLSQVYRAAARFARVAIPAHVDTFPRSHVRTLTRFHVLTFQRANVPTFQRSNVLTFQRSNCRALRVCLNFGARARFA
jgi:hypothetical protein